MNNIDKFGWLCVPGKIGIFCHRKSKPLESVFFANNGNVVKIVDAVCTTKTTHTKRIHTTCQFPILKVRK